MNLPKHLQETPIYDMSPFYSEFVPFTANSIYPIHRWYRFKEGFSRDLVHLILGSLDTKITDCLDPFAGSGTTPLACQEVGVNCYSIEVNPFLHHIAKTKLSTSYTIEKFDTALAHLKSSLSLDKVRDFDIPMMSTITERPGVEKFLFNLPVLQAILEIKHSIEVLDPIYANLMLVVLASILTDVGNTFKDGKCVRYKKGWRDKNITRYEVHEIFFRKADLFREDVQYIEKRKWESTGNDHRCLLGSALEQLPLLPNQSVDAVITSPPYLNSFDYTDVYMPELWVLGYVNDYGEVQKLRAETIKSHVQVKWETDEERISGQLRGLISEVTTGKEDLWNSAIPDMIAGYFQDMQDALKELRRIIRSNGKLCIVVATSSYNKVIIPTDLLIANLAVDIGFSLDEIRVMRKFNRSTKQTSEKGKLLHPLRESLLIFSA